MNSSKRSVLCIGGAGYVGSAVSRYLVNAGWEVTVLDDLSTGHRAALTPEVKFFHGDYAELTNLPTLEFDGIFIFAGKIRVEESMEKPWLYWNENVFKLIRFLKSLPRGSKVVFSSSAAVYKAKETPMIEEDATEPPSVYGVTKLAAEEALKHFAKEGMIRAACLRYFNAAGAELDGSHGEAHEPETHLIPRLCQYWLGKLDRFTVYGDDWPTPDGTCIRDFVHILDLAEGHLKALLFLERAEVDFSVFNLGSGKGASILEVINLLKEITGKDYPVDYAPRRAGDSARLIANISKAEKDLGWLPKYDLSQILESALKWHSKGWVYEE